MSGESINGAAITPEDRGYFAVADAISTFLTPTITNIPRGEGNLTQVFQRE
jgi:hypothetical protein